MNKKSAFSLMEMSVVIVVIAIVMAGVSQGSRLIQAWKIAAAQNVTRGSAVNAIKNLVLWLEPTLDNSFDTNIDDGSSIANWYDVGQQSVTKNNFSQATLANKPIYKINAIGGLPGLQFDGSASFMTSINSVTINSPDVSIFAVFKYGSGSLANERVALSIFSDSNTTTNNDGKNGIIIQNASATGFLRFLYRSPMGTSAGDDNYSTTPITENKNYILSSVRNFSSTSLRVWLNNVLTIGGSTTTAVVTNNMFDLSPLYVSIGRLNDSTIDPRSFKGQISEIIIFDRALKQSEIDDVTNYLSKKYKIKLG